MFELAVNDFKRASGVTVDDATFVYLTPTVIGKQGGGKKGREKLLGKRGRRNKGGVGRQATLHVTPKGEEGRPGKE